MQGGGKITHAQQFEQELWQKYTSSVTKRHTMSVCPNPGSRGEKQGEKNIWTSRGGQMNCYQANTLST